MHILTKKVTLLILILILMYMLLMEAITDSNNTLIVTLILTLILALTLTFEIENQYAYPSNWALYLILKLSLTSLYFNLILTLLHILCD